MPLQPLSVPQVLLYVCGFVSEWPEGLNYKMGRPELKVQFATKEDVDVLQKQPNVGSIRCSTEHYVQSL